MTARSLLLTVLLLCLLSAGTADPQYALSIPARLNSGDTGRACINIQGYNQNVQLSVGLQYGENTTSIFNENVTSRSFFKCQKFNIPVVQANSPVLVTLSISGGGVEILKRYPVVITVVNNIYLIQMDKPIYKPRQKVLFNLVSLNQNLLPVNELYTEVYLTDPMGSRLIQWLNQRSRNGLVSLEFLLIDDAAPGLYSLTAKRASSYVLSQWFTVEEYVLPRFTVSLDAKSILSILDETLTFNVSAMYTYGKPVSGDIFVQWCRAPTYGRVNNCYKDKNGACYNKKAKLTADGAYNGKIDLTYIQMELSGAQTYLNLSVTVTEDGTGIQVTQTQYMWVTSQLASISFDYERTNQYYKRGLPYSVRVFLQDQNGRPIVGEEVELQIEGVQEIQKIQTDVNGGAAYNIDTSSFLKPNFTIKASYPNTDQCYSLNWRGPDYPVTEYTVYRFYSLTGSFLQIIPPNDTLRCGQNQNIEVQFLLSTDGIDARTTKATFYYLTMSRSRIVQSGYQEVNVTRGKYGTFSLLLPVTSDMALSTDLIVYTILKKELITDTRSLGVESCFKNEVSLNFSTEIGPPASSVNLKITASPGSLCAVKVIDSSVLLLRSDDALTPELIYYSMQNWFYRYQVGEFNVELPEPPCEDPNKQIFYDGQYYVPVSSDSEGDTYTNIKNIGLVVGTDATVRKPVVCGQEGLVYPLVPLATTPKKSAAKTAALSTSDGNEAIVTVRTNFTDTWVWTIVSANSSGYGVLSQKAPDTITEWKGSMICTSEKDGFGMTKSLSSFKTFQPFFVEMSLPYSFIRGETLVLTASVANYLLQCVKVNVTLSPSAAYSATLQAVKQDACICSGERASYSWNVNALSLGVTSFTLTAQTTYIAKTCNGTNDPSQPARKDTVIQSIVVEAEGVKNEVTSSNLICAQGEKPQIQFIEMDLSNTMNLVPDSASGFITVLGDVIGLPLQNLDSLLQMPFGCGEHSLLRMAPIPYVLDYLETTKQLTNEIRQKAIQLMTDGYYRVVGYRLWSGAYSLFRGLSKENSWLAAYVFKTFEKCKKYIYIDQSIQQQTLIWLQNSQQLKSGCFRAAGDPFMRSRGGADDDISYTAYLTIALLESNYSLGATLLSGCLTCLQNALQTNQSIYNKALMVYAFTLAQDWDRRCTLLKSLRPKAISDAGTIHWEREDKPPARPLDFFYPLYSPGEVEMTSYILMAIAKGPNVTKEEMTFMAKVSVWLIRQQNSYGGFRSTQDTVVALQALSTFGKMVFNPNAQQIVVLKSTSIETTITVNNNNRLVVQSKPFRVPDQYIIGINGTGCCLVQATVRYNLPVPKVDSSFLVSANTSKNCVSGVASSFNIGISVSYRGKRNQTNMVVIDIAMLSGYQADSWLLQELVRANLVSNTVIKNNHVYLYLESVSNRTTYLSFSVVMGNRVLNVKTGGIYVYDSYETAENGFASYRHPCA
ncbi:ovostatin-like [Dendropsophus ebraccatus]|uniref:ovostatin-like n=1 Tax=Dendropsophus ebraccatus TaxID=150705 RepID=UPI0038316CFD